MSRSQRKAGNRKLVRPLHTRDGQTINTLGEARDLALKIPARTAGGVPQSS
jgi:hypothetical protein